MPPRDPLKLYGMYKRLPTLHAQFSHVDKKPYIGVTQGGSSRPNQPAKIAATDGEWKSDPKFKLKG